MNDPFDRRCPNCSTALTGPYCSECGQHQVDLDRPIWEFVAEGLATNVAFDTRIGRTLWPLIRNPGVLTAEFLSGKRARYVHPFKLYFAFSLIFFLVFSFSDYFIIHTNEPGIVVIRSTEEAPPDETGQAESLAEGGPTVATADDDAGLRSRP